MTHIAQATDGGGQLLSVLEKNRGVERIRYDFPGRELQLGPDGSVAIVDPTGSGELVGVIEAPWATDASGADVATRYEVRGSTLVQVVTPTRSTQYPVVADPTVKTYWWGFQVRFNRSETTRIAVGVGTCAQVVQIVPKVGVALRAACSALTLWAGAGIVLNKCIAVNVLRIGSQVKAAQPWYWGC